MEQPPVDTGRAAVEKRPIMMGMAQYPDQAGIMSPYVAGMAPVQMAGAQGVGMQNVMAIGGYEQGHGMMTFGGGPGMGQMVASYGGNVAPAPVMVGLSGNMGQRHMMASYGGGPGQGMQSFAGNGQPSQAVPSYTGNMGQMTAQFSGNALQGHVVSSCAANTGLGQTVTAYTGNATTCVQSTGGATHNSITTTQSVREMSSQEQTMKAQKKIVSVKSHRVRSGELQYCVVYEGTTGTSGRWLAASDITDCADMIEQYEERRKLGQAKRRIVKIYGIVDDKNGEFDFVVRFSDCQKAEVAPRLLVHKRAGKLLLEFYERNLNVILPEDEVVPK